MFSASERNVSKELTFVWGPPQSGQMFWISSVLASLEDEGINCHLCNLETFESSNHSVELTLANLDKSMEYFMKTYDDINMFCILPWEVTNQKKTFLENWLLSYPLFMDPHSSWFVHIVGLIPENAERLPIEFHQNLVEFASLTSSSMLMMMEQTSNNTPVWNLEDKIIFSDKIEVFEEKIIPNDAAVPVLNFIELNNEAKFEKFSLYIENNEKKISKIFEELNSGLIGNIWGAECFYIDENDNFSSVTNLSGYNFSWKSKHHALSSKIGKNGAILNISGTNILLESLMKYSNRIKQN